MPKKQSKKTILQLENIHKNYKTQAGELTVLQGVNLTLEAGQITAIVGASGSGKSTLLHIAGLLDEPNDGEIHIHGSKASSMSLSQKDLSRAQTFGFVYQQHHLLRELTAEENVLIPARIAGKKDENAHKRAAKLLKKVGLEGRKAHYPSQLSGGEQQRVALARAFMNQPDILLADEPTGNLDHKTSDDMAKLIMDMVREENMAVLLVTHSQRLAKKCDVVYTMKNGVLKTS